MPAPLLVTPGLVLTASGMYARALPRKRRKVVFTNLSSMTSHSGSNTHRLKRAYASLKVRTSITLGEIEFLKYCKEQLASVGRFYELDKDQFAERIRGVQWRFTTAAGGSAVCVAVPVGEASVM